MTIDPLNVAIISGVLMFTIGISIFARISKYHPDIYEAMGKPSMLSKDQLAVVGLLRRKRFKVLSRVEKAMVSIYIIALVIFVVSCAQLVASILS
jgi:hypothetical protein